MATIQVIAMWILLAAAAIVAVAFATTVFVLVKISKYGGVRPLVFTLVLLTLVTASGALWEGILWGKFSREAGSFKGMVAHPQPNYVDHTYTQRGREYEQRGFKVPLVVTVGVLFLIGTSGLILNVRAGAGLAALGVCSAAIACAGAFALFTGYMYLIATDFFI